MLVDFVNEVLFAHRHLMTQRRRQDPHIEMARLEAQRLGEATDEFSHHLVVGRTDLIDVDHRREIVLSVQLCQQVRNMMFVGIGHGKNIELYRQIQTASC